MPIIKKELGYFLVPKTYIGKIYFEPCFQFLKKNESGRIENYQQIYLGEKEGENISPKRNTIIHDADKLGLNTLLEPYSDKDSTMEQKLANCHAVYDIAIYKKRRVCATIKNYTVVTFDQKGQKDSYEGLAANLPN